MKATEQYFPVVLFIMLYKVVLTFESVDFKVLQFKRKQLDKSCPVALLVSDSSQKYYLFAWNPRV